MAHPQPIQILAVYSRATSRPANCLLSTKGGRLVYLGVVVVGEQLFDVVTAHLKYCWVKVAIALLSIVLTRLGKFPLEA